MPRADDIDVDLTPTQRLPSSSRLAPSPDLKPQGSRTRRTEVDDVFIDPTPCRPSPSTRCSYTLIPRELPPRSDPRSAHYPGFVVHQDPHVAAYKPILEDDVEDEDEESWKENSRVAVAKNIATPRSSNFPKGFLDGDKTLSSPKFKPVSSDRTRGDMAGLSSAPLFKSNGESQLKVTKPSTGPIHFGVFLFPTNQQRNYLVFRSSQKCSKTLTWLGLCRHYYPLP